MLYPARIVFCALGILPLPAIADEVDVAPAVVVTDSRLSSHYKIRNPAGTVLERSAIDRAAPANTLELLQSVVSVDAMRAGGEGGLTFVSVRGGDPNFTLFLLDGIKLNDPTNSRGGGVDLYMIPPQIIDAIEISPGPASVIHGSDGISGTVNIRTWPVSGFQVRGDLSSQNSKSIGVTFGGNVSEHLVGSLSAGRDDKTSEAEGDGLRQSYILGRASSAPADELLLDFVVFHVDGDASSFPEDSGGDRLAVIRTPETRDFRRQVFGMNAEWGLADHLALKGSVSQTRHRERAGNPGIAAGAWAAVPAVSGTREYSRFDGQLYLVVQPLTDLQVTAGMAFEREKGTSNDLIDFGGMALPADFLLERDSLSGFAELAYQLTPRLTLEGGLRHDIPDSEQDETSASLGLGYRVPVSDTELSLHYGEGFKLPSMFALGHPLVGNPRLLPEYSESLEFGVLQRWPAAAVEVGLSAFETEYRNLIDFDPVLFTNVNRGRVKVQGLDGRVSWQMHRDLAAKLHLTHSDAEVIGSSATLRRRPEWKGGAALSWRPRERLTWMTTANYTGSFFDSSIPTGVIEMPSFWRLDTALHWQASEWVQASLSVKNLLDDDYEESVGFSNGGITATLGLTVTI